MAILIRQSRCLIPRSLHFLTLFFLQFLDQGSLQEEDQGDLAPAGLQLGPDEVQAELLDHTVTLTGHNTRHVPFYVTRPHDVMTA